MELTDGTMSFKEALLRVVGFGISSRKEHVEEFQETVAKGILQYAVTWQAVRAIESQQVLFRMKNLEAVLNESGKSDEEILAELISWVGEGVRERLNWTPARSTSRASNVAEDAYNQGSFEFCKILDGALKDVVVGYTRKIPM